MFKKKILIGTINFIYALMYLKVCILYYFYFTYRCRQAIHYQTQMDFQNPISLLQFSISPLTFYACLTSEHLGSLLYVVLSQGNSFSVLVQGDSVGSLACGFTALSSPSYMGLFQTRTCVLEAEPSSWGGDSFMRFLFSPKMIVMEQTPVKWDHFLLKAECSEHLSKCFLKISPAISLSQGACHKHLQRWSGAFSIRCCGTKRDKHDF